MRRKILWITFWTTLAYWLGSFWGCAAPSGDRMTGACRAVVWAEAAQTQPAATRVSVGEPSLKGLDRSHWSKVTIELPAGTTHHYPLYFRDYAPADVPAQLESDAARLGLHIRLQDDGANGVEPKIDFSAPASMPATPAVRLPDPDELVLEDAVAGGQAKGWSSRNHQLSTLVQPFKFISDLIVWPVRMVQQHPWSDATSP